MKALFTKQQAFQLGLLYLQKQLDDSQDEYDSAKNKDEKGDALCEVKIAQKMVDSFKIEEFDNAVESELDGMEYDNGQIFYLDIYMDNNKVPYWELDDIKSLVEGFQEMNRETFENEVKNEK